ncbi:hypothetical protein V1478_001798 [Vespula squamosa]|uniref:Uncharacterized protein n=1 Tax=Vespula squamosa TaxID=30214 RepID=A0ABD2BY52_VESSQ
MKSDKRIRFEGLAWCYLPSHIGATLEKKKESTSAGNSGGSGFNCLLGCLTHVGGCYDKSALTRYTPGIVEGWLALPWGAQPSSSLGFSSELKRAFGTRMRVVRNGVWSS